MRQDWQVVYLEPAHSDWSEASFQYAEGYEKGRCQVNAYLVALLLRNALNEINCAQKWEIVRSNNHFDGGLPWHASIQNSDGFLINVRSATNYGKKYGVEISMGNQRDARGDLHYVPYNYKLPSIGCTLSMRNTAAKLAKRVVKSVIEAGQEMHETWKTTRTGQSTNIGRHKELTTQLAAIGVEMQQQQDKLKSFCRVSNGVYVTTHQGRDGVSLELGNLTVEQVARILEVVK